MQALLRKRQPGTRFRHTGVQIVSARYRRPSGGAPCAMARLDCAGDPKRLRLYDTFLASVHIDKFVVFLQRPQDQQTSRIFQEDRADSTLVEVAGEAGLLERGIRNAKRHLSGRAAAGARSGHGAAAGGSEGSFSKGLRRLSSGGDGHRAARAPAHSGRRASTRWSPAARRAPTRNSRPSWIT